MKGPEVMLAESVSGAYSHLSSVGSYNPTAQSSTRVQRAREALLHATSNPLVKAVLLAQFLSFLLAVTGTTSGLLVTRGIDMPTTQSFFNYCLLAVTCGAVHYRQSRTKLSNPWHTYLLLAFLDVEGNFLVTKAYQYTSVTSVTLLDCFTIPAVMFLSFIVFKSRYQIGHYGGAVLCILGLTVLVVTDGTSSTGGANPVLGDLLVILGACVYAICNVTQEKLLADTTAVEMLAMVGMYGSVISGVQAVVLDLPAWRAATWDSGVVLPLLGFSVSLYLFYICLPKVLVWSSCTVLNLSLLTSDFWAAGSRVVFFGGFGGTAGFFALAVVCEVVGLVVYTLSGGTHMHKQAAVEMESAGDVRDKAFRQRVSLEGEDEFDEVDLERAPMLGVQREWSGLRPDN